MSTRTYREGSPFPGRIGRTLEDSTAAFPVPPTPPGDATNVVLVVLDDVGFAQLGCFGSDIATPRIDALAARGLRYRRFHTTAMCSPTRASLLTGRNPHTAGIGGITELASGFPGYHGRLNPACATVPELAKRAGYATFAVGKWHLCPAEEQNAGARRRYWPLGCGFERFFGFLGPETSQWAPDLVVDNSPIPPVEQTDAHLSVQLVDRSISMIDDLRNADPVRPFFLYLAFGACHAPHHAPAEWIERYRGAFDDGWDAWRERVFERQVAEGIVPPGTTLSSRPSWVPDWADLDPDQRQVASRLMEAFAGFLSHTDFELGRLLDHLDATGESERTVVIVLSDNGASAEGGPTGTFNGAYLYNGLPHDAAATIARSDAVGGPDSFPNYPWGWAYAGNTPYRRWKRETHEGGIGDPLIVAGPGVAPEDPGAIRHQYCHAVDVGATLLDLMGVEMPDSIDGVAQQPVAGESLRPGFTDASRPGRPTQYYEQFGCRAIYHEGWKAVAFHPLFPYEPGEDPFRSFDEDRWELYDVEADPSECHDLAEQHPTRLVEMQRLWWEEAERFGALPLQGFRGAIGARLDKAQRIDLRPHALGIPESTAPDTKTARHVVQAEVVVPDSPAPVEGVLIAQGGRFGGFSLYLRGGRPSYTYNYFGTEWTDVDADAVLSPGRHVVRVEVTPKDATAVVVLIVDGRAAAVATVPRLVPLRFALSGENLCCGYDDATEVSPRYEAPFRCTVPIEGAFVDATGAAPIADPDEVRRALQTQ
ncbi:MAG: arylsulfatase [Microthrixaceae bacterium]